MLAGHQVGADALGSADFKSPVLNNCGLSTTYSAQSSDITRCTTSGLKLVPFGLLLPR